MGTGVSWPVQVHHPRRRHRHRWRLVNTLMLLPLPPLLLLLLVVGVDRPGTNVWTYGGRHRCLAYCLAWMPKVTVRSGTSSAVSDLVEPETNFMKENIRCQAYVCRSDRLLLHHAPTNNLWFSTSDRTYRLI